MIHAQSTIDQALSELDRLRTVLKRGTTRQVNSSEDRSVVKATALAWFNSHRPVISNSLDDESLISVDDGYKQILLSSDKAGSRSHYLTTVKQTRQCLSRIRLDLIAAPHMPATTTPDNLPNFGKLVPDPAMQAILARRWQECTICVSAAANLASIVMMGGLLEGLLLARVNLEPNKTAVFTCAAAPRDHKSGNPLPLQDWTLRNYIDVAHELKWISRSAKDVGQVLRDYRNYIHPQKELSHAVVLTPDDARILWEVAKGIARELL